jgi:hypothetical protein
MNDKGLKKAVRIGAAIGGLFSFIMALSMDLLMADSLSGTWWDAAAKDAVRMFGPFYGQNVVVVALVLLVVIGFLVGFGALLGAAAGFILNRFFKIMLKL